MTGALTEGDSITTPDSCGGIPYHYDTFTFVHGGGEMSLAVRGASSSGGTLPDPIVILFAGTGLPGNPCAPEVQLGYDDENGCGHDAYLVTTQAAGTYTAMVLDFNGSLGTYTFERNTFTGTNVCP